MGLKQWMVVSLESLCKFVSIRMLACTGNATEDLPIYHHSVYHRCICSTIPIWIHLFLSLYLPLLKSFANALECEAVACNSSLCRFVCENVGGIFNLHWQTLVSISSNPFNSTHRVSYVLLILGCLARIQCSNSFLGAKLLLHLFEKLSKEYPCHSIWIKVLDTAAAISQESTSLQKSEALDHNESCWNRCHLKVLP